MSFSNSFDVEFQFQGTALPQRLQSFGIKSTNGTTLSSTSPSDPGAVVKLFCDEAQLPNIQAATGTTTGIFMGEGQVNYPHTRLYSDFQLSWMCDANMTPLKFLEVWYSFIFQEFGGTDRGGGQGSIPIGSQGNAGNYQSKKTLDQIKQEAGRGNAIDRFKRVRLNYPSTYLANVIITKTERSKNAPNGRAPISYTLIDAYPYSIDAVPLSYGASQVTKVSANFYYAKHFVTHNNIRDYNG